LFKCSITCINKVENKKSWKIENYDT
jgi:hypothetical protein